MNSENQTEKEVKPSENQTSLKTKDSVVTENNVKKPFRPQDRRNNKEKMPRNRQDFSKMKEQSEFIEKVIWIRRINKVTTGGRRLRFSAAVVVGNKKGTVGLGVAKANEVKDAIRKSVASAHKKLIQVAINKDYSIYHDSTGNYGASKILLKPAKEGIGVKAGGSARDIINLAGIQNIYAKSLGSNNKINLARATIAGLTLVKSEESFKNRIVKRKISPVLTETKK